MLRFYAKFVVQRCIVCCDRRHLDKSTSDYIRNTGTQGSCKRSCVLKSHLRFEIASAFRNRICVLKSQLRFEIAAAIATQLRFQNVTSPRAQRPGRKTGHMHRYQPQHSPPGDKDPFVNVDSWPCVAKQIPTCLSSNVVFQCCARCYAL